MTGADGIGPQRSRAAMAAVGFTLLLLTAAFEAGAARRRPLRARAVTKTDDGIRVSAAVPSEDPALSSASTSTSAASNRSGWRLRMAASDRFTSCRPGWTRNTLRLWKLPSCMEALFMTRARRRWPRTSKP